MQIEVNPELVKRVAQNARLALTDDELKRFSKELKEVILDSFNKLDELDVSDTEASFQPIKKINVFRKDEVKESLSQEKALENVKPELRENGFIKGPKVM